MQVGTRTRLLDAAIDVIREQGYAATSVDELCARAGVTKGAFFHYFPSKEALGAATADYWSERTSALFAGAPYHEPKDPLDRVLAYIDFRRAMIAGAISNFTCVAGTLAQEVYDTSDPIRDACWRSIVGHAATLEDDIADAARKYGVGGVNARSLALFTQATLQGAFILAKAKNDPAVAIDMVGHLRRYVELLFAANDAEERP
jgi:TetR/AcrR family transcriptional repressor of nem operon